MKPWAILVFVAALVGSAICLGLIATASVRSVARMWTEAVANAEPGCDRERLAAQLHRFRQMCRGCAEAVE